jgi:superfamily II DNA or RNA helicase
LTYQSFAKHSTSIGKLKTSVDCTSYGPFAGKKQRRTIAEAIAAVPESESRVILATGSYIGEGFDDARLDTLFLAMPISWKGTLQQYVGRLHRLHDAKHVVRVYDYVDSQVLMLARMYARRLRGYGAIGYGIGAVAAEGPSPSD